MFSSQGLSLFWFQRLRKLLLILALMGVGALALFSLPNPVGSLQHEGLEILGRILIVVCIVGRGWCSLYIGGRKKAEIVDRGPYSISRNPLYLLSYLGAFGMGAQMGSLTMALIFLLLTMGVFYLTVRREEAYLIETFGETYLSYCARVPRFGPDFRKWQDEDQLVVRPRFFVITLADGLFFLLAIPVFETIEWAQSKGWFEPIFYLP